MLMTKVDRMIKELINREVSNYIYSNLQHKGKVRKCLNCDGIFTFRSKYHQFCSRACYSQAHRIPGFVRHIINHKD